MCFLYQMTIIMLDFCAKLHKNFKKLKKVNKKGCNFVTFWYNKNVKSYKIVIFFWEENYFG